METLPGANDDILRTALLAAGLALSIVIPSDQYHPPTHDRDGCMIVSEHARKAADKLLHLPEDPVLQEARNNPRANDNVASWRVGKAAEHGLTLHPFNRSDHIEQASDPAASWKTSREYLQKFGVNLEIGTSAEIIPVHGTPLTPQRLQSSAFANNLLYFNATMSRYPEEFIRDTMKLKRIVLMEGSVHESHGQTFTRGGYVVSTHPDTIYLDWLYMSNAYEHEQGHRIDKLTGCEDTSDPSFTTHNPYKLYGDPALNGYMSMERYLRMASKSRPADMPPAARQFLAKEKARVMVVNEGSLANRKEDAADIYAEIQRANFAVYTLGNSPVIEAKFAELTGRMYTIDPATMRYLAQTANRDLSTMPPLTPER